MLPSEANALFMDEPMPLPILPLEGALDQRRAERIYCQRMVRLKTSDHREFDGICTDVNRTGIGLDSDWILAVGQRVELLLARGQRVPMLVIYRMGKHYGLSALKKTEAVLELLPQQ